MRSTWARDGRVSPVQEKIRPATCPLVRYGIFIVVCDNNFRVESDRCVIINLGNTRTQGAMMMEKSRKRNVQRRRSKSAR